MRRIDVVAAVAILAAGCAGSGAAPGPRPGAATQQEHDTWRVISESPLAPGYGHKAVWTGEEMLVWGGSRRDKDTLVSESMRDGAAYNPRTDSWRGIPPAPAPGGGGYSVTWTGTEMVVWGDPDSARSTIRQSRRRLQSRHERLASNPGWAFARTLGSPRGVDRY